MQNQNAQGIQERGGSRNRGRGRIPPQPQVINQVKTFEKALKPKEMKLLAKFAPMGASRVRSTYGRSGILSMEVGFIEATPDVAFPPGQANDFYYLDRVVAESAFERYTARQNREMLVRRAPERLGREIVIDQIGNLTQEERRVLNMSNKDYASFRARQPLVGQVAPLPAQAANNANLQGETQQAAERYTGTSGENQTETAEISTIPSRDKGKEALSEPPVAHFIKYLCSIWRLWMTTSPPKSKSTI
jgi:hypothetical protein